MEILNANKRLLSVNNIRMEECQRETSKHQAIFLFPPYDPAKSTLCKSHPKHIWSEMTQWGDDTFQDNDYIISFNTVERDIVPDYDR